MGSLTWKGGPGVWSDAANWSIVSGTASVPGAADDATIDVATNYVVTVSGTQAAHNVTLNASGAKLTVTGTFAVGGTLFDQSGTLITSAASVLQGGKYALVGGSETIGDGSTLDGTTWQNPLALPSTGTINIRNGLTLQGSGGAGPGALTIATGSTKLMFLDSTTLDNAALGLSSFIAGGEEIASAAGALMGKKFLLLFSKRRLSSCSFLKKRTKKLLSV